MRRYQLRCSRIELVFVSGCHLSALISALLADIPVALRGLLAIAVVASYIHYLRGVFLTFFRRDNNVIGFVPAFLVIGQQSAQVPEYGKVVETELPKISYFSEYLLLLSFSPVHAGRTGRVGVTRFWGKVVKVVIWPDSLSRNDNRSLRRYLRFDCPQV
jgi:hypothetical protein